MNSRFDAAESYLGKSRRVRETFSRYTLADLLWMVFSDEDAGRRPSDAIASNDPRWPRAVDVTTLNDEEFEHVVRLIQDRVTTIDRSWEPSMNQREPLPRDARAQVARAFATLRECARAVATQQPTARVRMTVDVFLPFTASDRDGRPRWMLRGALADGIVWMGLKLLSEVERSLIRPCAMDGCERVYVAIKNQRYCLRHQAQAQRAAQRRAEQAFRARQRATTKKTKKRRT